MKFISTILIIAVFNTVVLGNDGAFRASGNQLVPVMETDITVKKEILTLKKIRNQYIEVTVYYEFWNPKDNKTLTVGFEALSPSGDVDGTPNNGMHPYISDFTVQLNNEILAYDLAYVTDSAYAKNGIIKSKKLSEILSNELKENYVDWYYVYHFKAKFKKGLNIIKHTYSYDLSNSVYVDYYFDYVLTAANRWGNKQIDDFTLVLDLGEFESFSVNKNFFKTANEWIINGIGKSDYIKGVENSPFESEAVKFHIQRGSVIFQKKNFHPTGELFVISKNYIDEVYKNYIPFSYYQQDKIKKPLSDADRRILKNLPFARRGYIFQNPELKKYYEGLDWYMPNPGYIPDVKHLTDIEKAWIRKWE